MEREILTLESKEFDGVEYREFLRSLIQSDRELAFRVIPQLALRSARRIVPLLGVTGNLNF